MKPLYSVTDLSVQQPTKRVRATAKAKAEITEIGTRLIAEKKAAILQEAASNASLEKKDIQGNDLLSLLIRANLASDLPETSRLSDKDILAQVPTFLVAGVSVMHNWLMSIR